MRANSHFSIDISELFLTFKGFKLMEIDYSFVFGSWKERESV